MKNQYSSFNEFNYNRKVAKIKLYNSILSAMTRPMTIDDIIEAHQFSRKPSFYNPILINLVKAGCIESTGKAKFNRKIYKVIKPVHEEALGIRPAKAKERSTETIIEGARVIRLTDKHHHARMPHKQRSAWTGSTLGTMAY
jgi:hypothetical protein